MQTDLNGWSGTARAGELMLITASLIWGASVPLMKELISQMEPSQLVFYRFGPAVLIWLPFVLKKRAEFKPAWMLPGMICGLALGTVFPIGITSLVYTSATRSGFLHSITVILVPLTAFIVFRQSPGNRVMLAALLALAGSYFMTSMDAVQNLPLNPGDLLALLSAFCYTISITCVGYYSGRVPPFWLNFLQTVWVALIGLGWCMLDQGLLIKLNYQGWWELGGLVIFCTAFGFWAQAWGQARTSASRAALIYAMEPVAAAFIAAMLLGERLGFYGVLGSGLIMAGVLIVAMKAQPKAAAQV